VEKQGLNDALPIKIDSNTSEISGRWMIDRPTLQQKAALYAWQAKPYSHHAIISSIAQRGNGPGS
jgi:hypothetical protein